MSVAEWAQRRAPFCDLIDSPYIHPHPRNVLRRSSIFNTGRTFSIYPAHLGRACQLLSIPPTWRAASVRWVASGLEGAQDLSLKIGD